MGNLTDSMTRLRGEVDALRNDRMTLMHDLACGASDLTTAVDAMRDDFAAAHKAMAKKTGRKLKDFVAAMTSETNSLLGAYSKDRVSMARKGKRDRANFLSKMRSEVHGMCNETADDLMGARLVWRGESQPLRPVRMKKKEPAESALKKTKKGKK